MKYELSFLVCIHVITFVLKSLFLSLRDTKHTYKMKLKQFQTIKHDFTIQDHSSFLFNVSDSL